MSPGPSLRASGVSQDPAVLTCMRSELDFLKRKAPTQNSAKSRTSGKLLLSFIWPRNFRTRLSLGQKIQNRVKFDATYQGNVAMSQLGLDEIRVTLAN